MSFNNKSHATPSTPSSVFSSLQPPLIFPSAYSIKPRHTLTFAEQGRTKQSFKDECDINIIMRRFAVTGELPPNTRTPVWGDIPELDFQGAMAIVVQAREAFETLPAEVRDRFQHDPGRLLAFLRNPDNKEEAIKLGLINKPQPTATAPATPPEGSPTGTPPATPPSAS